jgi:hypothetical protein
VTATGAQATTSVPLAAGRWSLWRSMVMRGAGFAVADLLALGDPACRVAADAVAATAAQDGPPAGYEQFRSAFDAAARRATAALSTLVGQDRFREALLWQNRAVVPMLDAHLREVAAGGPRNATRRRREAQRVQDRCPESPRRTIARTEPAARRAVCRGSERTPWRRTVSRSRGDPRRPFGICPEPRPEPASGRP